MQYISSNQNDKFKLLKKLKQKKHRIIEKKIILEGRRVISHARGLGVEPEIIAYDLTFPENAYLRDYKNDILLETALFNQISDTVNSQGIIGIFSAEKINTRINPLSKNLVILNGVQDPGNLGTIIRTCDALGFDRLILSKNTTDPYSQKALRSSMASIFNVSLKIGMENSDIIAFLKKNGYRIIVSSLEASKDINRIEVNDKFAIVFGNEGSGVDELFIQEADILYKIGMREGAESFNVGVAAGISLYELRK